MTSPDFNKAELIPAIIQDYYTQQVLMLGYMNEEAWSRTVNTNIVTFFSRSRKTIWIKGETSGNYLTLKEIYIDCDKDTILIKAIPQGPVCHRGDATCFLSENKGSSLKFLEQIIAERKDNITNSKSYTRRLFQEGTKKIAQKVGEEAVELALEATGSNDHDFLNEGADLLFHYLVLLQAKGYKLDDVVEVLKTR